MTGTGSDGVTDATLAAGPARGSRVAVAGFVFAALFLLAWLMLRGAPGGDANAQELLDYYGDPGTARSSLLAGLYVVPAAGIAFIWFLAALRDRYGHSAQQDSTILSTAHVVAGVLVVTSLFILAAVELAAVWLGENAEPSESTVTGIRSLLALGDAFSDIMALRAAAVFVAISATRAVRSGLFPRSFGVVSVPLAVALLLVPEAFPGATLLFPAWVAAASALILLSHHARGTVPGA